MKLSLNQLVDPMSRQLDDRAVLFAGESSPTKRPYVEERTQKLTSADKRYVLKRLKQMLKLPYSLWRTRRLSRANQASRTQLDQPTFSGLQALFKQYHIDSAGWFKLTPQDIFKGHGVPHDYALVLSIAMDNAQAKTAPSMAFQFEALKIYGETGMAAVDIAQFLQRAGFAAVPNHSVGGQIDYSMAAARAGLAVIGRHSMAISRENGPCHRLAVIYTSIDNWADFIDNDQSDMQWVKDFCNSCGKCVRSCPEQAIYAKAQLLDGYNPTVIDYQHCAEGFQSYGCGVCIKVCPFTTVGYHQLYAAYINRQQRLDKTAI